MNICLVSQHFPPDTARGGIGTQAWNKAGALARRGHTVHVLACAAARGPELQSSVRGGVHVHRIQPPGETGAGRMPIYNEITYWVGYSWTVLTNLQQLLQRTTFDVIDFAEYGAEGFAFQLDQTEWNRTPVVVQLHAPLAMLAEHIGWPEKDSELYRVGTAMEGLSIRKADALMACSANIANFTAAHYGVPRDSIDVVHCGVDTEAFHPPNGSASANGARTVLFVGNIASNKGLETTVEAVLRLRPRLPDVKLRIAGTGDEGLVERCRAAAAATGAADALEFCGFVGRDELPPLYRHATAFCSPAQYEGGVANVYLEAMASGCPVVASTAGGAPEAVTDGENGLLVPPNDVDATANALVRILAQPAERARMSRAARARAEQGFAMDVYIERVLATYERAIARATAECST